MESSWTTDLIKKICAEKKLIVDCYDLESPMCRIKFPNGKSTLFYSSTFNVNGVASRVGSVDKAYAKFFLSSEGISVPKGEIVFSDYWCEKKNLIETKQRLLNKLKNKQEFPLIIKPNRGFQGRFVYKADNLEEVNNMLDMVLENKGTALVEECVTGHEYRIVMYQGVLQAAYLKTPLSVVGDGERSIEDLLDKKRLEQMTKGRGDVISLHLDYIKNRLHGLGYTFGHVLPVGFCLNLRDNANLSTGGELFDVTQNVHPDYIILSRKIAEIMDLKLIGIDIITETPIEDRLSKYWVLEVAFTPGLQHFASLGQSQYKTVKNMYENIIEDIILSKNA